jgi:hypothetical protein
VKRAVRPARDADPSPSSEPAPTWGALGNSARVLAFQVLRDQRAEADPGGSAVFVGPPWWNDLLGEDPAPRLVGQARAIQGTRAVVLDDALRPVQPARVLPVGMLVDVLEVRHHEGRDYVRVEHAGAALVEVGPRAPTMWIERGQLAGEHDYQRASHAAWDAGRYLGQIDLLTVQGGKVPTPKKVSAETFPFYARMAAAAASDGVPLQIESGFRTYGHQKRLHDAYVADPAHANVAARPGRSNHEDGLAYDIVTEPGKDGPHGEVVEWPKSYVWLVLNAWRFGFVRTVPSETWHWEYRPAEASEAGTSYGTRPRLLAYARKHPEYRPYGNRRPVPDDDATASGKEVP